MIPTPIARYGLSLIGVFALSSAAHGAVLFTESFGTVTKTTSLVDHATAGGFDSPGVFSGSVELRHTTASTAYTGASSGANVFLASGGASWFQIDGISTLGSMAGTIELTFGAYKSSILSDLSALTVEFSENSTDWTTLSFPGQPTGSGTSVWRLLTVDESPALPVSGTLSLRWTNTSSDTQFRIDDVRVSAVPEPSAWWLSVGSLLMVCRRGRRAC